MPPRRGPNVVSHEETLMHRLDRNMAVLGERVNALSRDVEAVQERTRRAETDARGERTYTLDEIRRGLVLDVRDDRGVLTVSKHLRLQDVSGRRIDESLGEVRVSYAITPFSYERVDDVVDAAEERRA